MLLISVDNSFQTGGVVYFFFSALPTKGCTNLEMSPPKKPTSLTNDDDINEYSSEGIKKTDSISGAKFLFMLAS